VCILVVVVTVSTFQQAHQGASRRPRHACPPRFMPWTLYIRSSAMIAEQLKPCTQAQVAYRLNREMTSTSAHISRVYAKPLERHTPIEQCLP